MASRLALFIRLWLAEVALVDDIVIHGVESRGGEEYG
jgi:hypothetical protein